MVLDVVKAQLEKTLDKSLLKYNEPMKNHTSFKVGGPADMLVIPDKVSQVGEIIKICRKNDVPFFIMGNGTNLIVRDGGYRGVIIKLTALNKIKVDGVKVKAQAGASLSNVSREALKSSLKGMAFASGIPGTVGGAIAMNAGAYDGEIKNIVESVLLCDMHGKTITLKNKEMDFGYRHSIVHTKNYIVLEATFHLEKGNYDEIKARMEELNKRRIDKQPLNYPSAGSTFKRPEGYFAGKLIEDSGLKGLKVGGAMVSEKHAGFVINYDNATASDVLGVISEVQKRVMENYNVKLDTEVKIIGED